ncbi:MAG: hypothetical protein JWR33_2442 [Naasia sp.]|jgi:biotin-dependent carboxylase-like uncharacterized protein|uniref:5-oxoprolinase subunit C family protein n=1 Tax=Naasia sp. TaxID=2546198 RepID=UPI00262E2A6F|nr:biotin-dependent carboxyltransferase family protein [Naasia sp.]MCU1571701.1 hypothetical protein [Naasia sp.]
MPSLTVLRPGALATVQDLGRPGLAALGVGPSGAFDRRGHLLANRLVGNPADAAGLELLLGGAALRAESPLWMAVTGAWGPVTADGWPVEPHTAVLVPAGAVLEFGAPESGLRYSLAVRGGIDVPPVLGSRSWDTLARLGPSPLTGGQQLPVGGPPHTDVPAVDLVPVGPPPSGTLRLEILPGPRRDWFEDAAWGLLTAAEWRVSARSDRTGVRLEGPELRRSRHEELPSEGMVAGAVQVSPDGIPTVLGVDAPVTGGYPVIAVLALGELDRLAQARPGQRVVLARAFRRG